MLVLFDDLEVKVRLAWHPRRGIVGGAAMSAAG